MFLLCLHSSLFRLKWHPCAHGDSCKMETHPLSPQLVHPLSTFLCNKFSVKPFSSKHDPAYVQRHGVQCFCCWQLLLGQFRAFLACGKQILYRDFLLECHVSQVNPVFVYFFFLFQNVPPRVPSLQTPSKADVFPSPQFFSSSTGYWIVVCMWRSLFISLSRSIHALVCTQRYSSPNIHTHRESEV